MAATRADIQRWLKEGQAREATHVIIVCDTFDHEDYPVFVQPGEDAHKIAEERFGYPDGEKNMQRVMECYDLSLPLDQQMAEHRAFHW